MVTVIFRFIVRVSLNLSSEVSFRMIILSYQNENMLLCPDAEWM